MSERLNDMLDRYSGSAGATRYAVQGTRIPAAVCIPYGGRPAVAAEQLQTYLAQSDGSFLLRRGARGDQGDQTQERHHQAVEANAHAALFPTPLCQAYDKKIFIFSCPHDPAFLIGILPPPVSVRRQKKHEVVPFLPAAYSQKLCCLFCNKTQSA